MRKILLIIFLLVTMLVTSCSIQPKSMTCGNDICELDEEYECPQDCGLNGIDILENGSYVEENTTYRVIDITDRIPTFDEQIGEWTLSRVQEEPEECMNLAGTSEGRQLGIGGEVCFLTKRYEYSTEDDLDTHVNIVDVKVGLKDYLRLVEAMASENMYAGFRLFRTESNEVAWLSDGYYRMVIAKEFERIPHDSGWSASYHPVPEGNAVVLHFLEKIPPSQKMIDDLLKDE